ncbi:MAG: hypothetical protein ACPGR8_01180 [Limisphaerales bacterium]
MKKKTNMANKDFALLHAFAAVAALSWAAYLYRTVKLNRSSKVRWVWLAFTPGFLAPIWSSTTNALFVGLSATALASAVAATVVVFKPNLTSTVAGAVQAAPLIAHTSLTLVAAFGSTTAHWLVVGCAIASPLAAALVVFFT